MSSTVNRKKNWRIFIVLNLSYYHPNDGELYLTFKRKLVSLQYLKNLFRDSQIKFLWFR